MTTSVGDYIRPLPGFTGLVLPDSTRVGLQRAVPVGPVGGAVRDALAHVKPSETFADDDWVTLTWDDAQTLADAPPNVGILADPFDGTSLSSLWMVRAGSPRVSGGKLHLPNTYPQSAMASAITHALSGTTATLFGLVAPLGSAGDSSKNRGMTIQSVSNPGVNFVQILKLGSLLLTRTGPGTVTTYTYNATAHANLRIRCAGTTTIYFEYSADGVAWSLLRSVAAPTWVATGTVWILIAGGAYSASYSDPATESTIDRVLWA